jgi:hypothetical protein
MSDDDKMKQKTSHEDITKHFEIDETFGEYLMFSDAKVNKMNVHIWVTEQLHVNIFLVVSKDKGAWPLLL